MAVEEGVDAEFDADADALRHGHALAAPEALGGGVLAVDRVGVEKHHIVLTVHDEVGRDLRTDRPAQNASDGTYVPQTSRSALHTSPTVARTRSASFIG
ncbi:hypothetical protein GCM10010448_12640 [Streptomyces glomeratus]|uniref:Uncharacterized protein n=1 Tax=Streptomyces glomeratus TaxID=284452 RepID=A0ABP6L8R9_9ACTN